MQLQSEDKVIGPDGKLLSGRCHAEQGERAVHGELHGEVPEDISLASRSSLRLRNCIDLLVAAAFLQREDYYGQASWEARTLLDEKQLATQTENTPKQAPCAANSLWKGSRLLTPAGGGVSIMPRVSL